MVCYCDKVRSAVPQSREQDHAVSFTRFGSHQSSRMLVLIYGRWLLAMLMERSVF